VMAQIQGGPEAGFTIYLDGTGWWWRRFKAGRKHFFRLARGVRAGKPPEYLRCGLPPRLTGPPS